MTIDLSESILTLKEACKFFPRSRRGKKAHLSRLYRYSTTGCRGVVLETIQCGATRCTSVQAIDRFFRALTEQAVPSRENAVKRERSSSESEIERQLDDVFGSERDA